MIKGSNRKKCPITFSEHSQLFSLVDYRNNYFTSDDQNKIIEFYNGFENRDQLIQWMKERPKGVANVHEVEGDKDIIVVIPTADFNGKYAKECRESIFKGLHMVFVESGGRGDFYFNYGHNCNVGIQVALKYNAKWVIISNDDMHAVDSISVLTTQLRNINHKKISCVFINQPSDYFSASMQVSKIRVIRNLMYFIFRGVRNKQRIIEKKFSIKYVGVMERNTFNRFLYKPLSFQFFNFISFGIFSINAMQSMISKYGYVFDEIFINNSEDGDLSIRLAHNNERNYFINFRITPEKGGSLGWGGPRCYRDMVGAVYLSKKLEDYFE